MVQKVGEPLLLPPCRLSYAAHPLFHAGPALCPSALISAFPVALALRSTTLRRHAGFVRRLHRYYDGVDFSRLHHWLRLLAFPMRAADAQRQRSDVRSPRFRRDPFERDGVFDLGRAAAPRFTETLMLPSTLATISASAIGFSWLNSPPLSIAVYASRPPSPTVHATLATRQDATHLPVPDFHRLDRASFPGAPLTASAVALC